MTMTDRMVDLVEGGFHLAVRNMAVPDFSLIARRVATYRFVVCGSPAYFAARGIPKQPADLAHHNCLVYSRSAWGNEWHFAGPDGEQSVAVSRNLQANSGNALRLAAVHGQGVALAPSFLLIGEIKSGRLVPVLTEYLQTDHAINAIYPHRHHVSAKVRCFIDLLAKHFREDPGLGRSVHIPFVGAATHRCGLDQRCFAHARRCGVRGVNSPTRLASAAGEVARSVVALPRLFG